MKKVSIFLLVLFFYNFSIYAQTHEWQKTNPGGGGAFSTIGAGVTGIVIAGSDLSGAYRSLDKGQTWDVIGRNRGLTATHVSGVGFHPTNGNILYIGTDAGIFRSEDGGETVEQVLSEGYITDVEVANNNSEIGYATFHPVYNSNQGVIYKTNNNGLSWSQVSTDLPGGLRILKLIINPQDDNMVWLLSGQGRFACGPAQVWRSNNGGENWNQQAENLGEILDIAVSHESAPSFYLTNMNADCSAQYYWTDLEGSFFKSTDLGENWANMENLTGVIWVNSENTSIRLIDPREPYPWIDDAGTWESTDGGNNWEKIGFLDDWNYGYQGEAYLSYGTNFNGISKALGHDLSDPNTLYWATTQWAYGTFDGGKVFQNLHTNNIGTDTWQSTGFDNVNMMDLAISEVNPNLIYLAYFDIGLWRSFDNGESWQSCNHSDYTGGWEGAGGNVATVLADPQRENTVWSTMSGNQNGESPTYFLRSDIAGEKTSWVLSNTGLPDEEIIGLSIDRQSPMNNRTLFITAQGDIYRSENDGFNWTKVLDNGGFRYTAVDYFNGDLIYAGGEDGVWKSEDGGDTWTEIGLPAMGGDSNIGFWEWGWTGVFGITTDPHQEGWVYITSFGNEKGLWRSKNGGDDWEKLLTDNYMRRMTVSPNDSNVLYATSSSALESGGWEEDSHGILFSKDGGENWEEANNGMAWKFAAAVEVSSTNWVFVGSPGTGFQKAEVPNTVAISNVSNDLDIHVFPNPTQDFISISFKNFERNINYKLTDLTGRILQNKHIEKINSTFKINTNDLKSGAYFLIISDEKNTWSKKIIKI